MRLTVANISKSIQQQTFQDAVKAIRRQCQEDFEPEWNIQCVLRGTKVNIRKKAPIDGVHDAIIYVGDESQDPTTGVQNALGYHSDNHAGIPYGFVYLDVVQEVGEEWTTTLSHEVLELLADPAAVVTVAGPDPRDNTRTVQFDLEVCDPTQGDSYDIDGVSVSNFVTRSYFGLAGPSTQTNFLELDLQPFGVRPGGYFQFEDGEQVFQVQGEKVTTQLERRHNARIQMSIGRRNTRRALRLPGSQELLKELKITPELGKKAFRAAAGAGIVGRVINGAL
jgi:hypothetical protein